MRRRGRTPNNVHVTPRQAVHAKKWRCSLARGVPGAPADTMSLGVIASSRLEEMPGGDLPQCHFHTSTAAIRTTASSARSPWCDGRSSLTASLSFDDCSSPRTPGVAPAVWQEVFAHGLRPLAATLDKLYCSYGAPPQIRVADARVESVALAQHENSLYSAAIGSRAALVERWLPPVVRLALSRAAPECASRERQELEGTSGPAAEPPNRQGRWANKRARCMCGGQRLVP